jgi:hypothetical protein
MVLRRVGVRSAIQLFFWLSIALGFVQVMIYVLYAIATGAPASHFNLDFWIGFLVRLALFSAHSAVTAGVLAYVYNWVSKRFGGLHLEFEPSDTPLEKRKNDEDVIV